MRRAQLFSQDIIFAILIVLFALSLWFMLRNRVLHTLSLSEYKRTTAESASRAMGQLLESAGEPTDWHTMQSVNETTLASLGLASSRNTLDTNKVTRFVELANEGGANYAAMKKLLGLEQSGYAFNFTVSLLNGTSLYAVNRTPSAFGSSPYSTLNTTVVVERYALLNNSFVKVTLGVWIE